MEASLYDSIYCIEMPFGARVVHNCTIMHDGEGMATVWGNDAIILFNAAIPCPRPTETAIQSIRRKEPYLTYGKMAEAANPREAWSLRPEAWGSITEINNLSLYLSVSRCSAKMPSNLMYVVYLIKKKQFKCIKIMVQPKLVLSYRQVELIPRETSW